MSVLMDALGNRLSDMLMNSIAELDWDQILQLSNPVLRLEALVHDGNAADPHPPSSPHLKVQLSTLNLAEYLRPGWQWPSPPPSQPDHVLRDDDRQGHRPPIEATVTSPLSTDQQHPDKPTRRPGAVSFLRPARSDRDIVQAQPSQDESHSVRQMHVPGNYHPKRAKIQRDEPPALERQCVEKLIEGIWEQIHGGISLEPQALLEQWRLAPTAMTAIMDQAVGDDNRVLVHGVNDQPGHTIQPRPILPPISHPVEPATAFNCNNVFCRKVTQASRACRAIEVVVQARWTEHFDAHVAQLALTLPALSPTKRRKTALLEACADFGWSEKELRNKMAVWRGYKEVKDAGGWAALVFAGMGLYRFCKYRADFSPDALARLRAVRPRLELAADTLHPTWRQLLLLVDGPTDRRFEGHPHDWVVSLDGAEPVPLRATYLTLDPSFTFQHVQDSVVNTVAWGDEDPRCLPPSDASGIHRCRSCGQEQSEDAAINCCYCFPEHFSGQHPRKAPPVQVFATGDGRRNGLLALCAFERGSAVGEFVGEITRGLADVDVLDSPSSVNGRAYQIWQGVRGNYTRFVNHSCRPNAQFQEFLWLGLQRIMLVSKGIAAGEEVTVDYSQSYWLGLDKDCLCGEACCNYKTNGRR